MKNEVQDDLASQVQQLAADLKALKDTAGRVATDKLRHARGVAADYVEGRKERASEVEDQLLEAVRADPLKGLLIAGGIGLLLGAIWSRR